MVVPEPTTINNWVVWGDFVESVLLDFKEDIWDEDEKEYYIELVHRPTNLMRFTHQIENKGKDYDRTRDAFVSKFPMDMEGIIKSRTKGTYIFMLCDWKGNKTNIFEKISNNLFEENKRLRTEINAVTSMLVRQQTRMVQLAKHPEPLQKVLINQARELKKITGPAVIGGQPVNPQGEEDNG